MGEVPEKGRKADELFRITGGAVPEIRALWDSEEQRVLPKRLKFQGRKVKAGRLLIAAVLNWLRIPPEERDRAYREGLSLFEAILEREEPVDLRAALDRLPPLHLAEGNPPGRGDSPNPAAKGQAPSHTIGRAMTLEDFKKLLGGDGGEVQGRGRKKVNP